MSKKIKLELELIEVSLVLYLTEEHLEVLKKDFGPGGSHAKLADKATSTIQAYQSAANKLRAALNK